MPHERVNDARTTPLSGGVDALVIGGGIAGCTLAYELASRGVKTVVVEQAVVAAESSGRNTGTMLSGPQKEVVEMLDAYAVIYKELADGPVPFDSDRSATF
jgi:D-hydroxyproline dehydrogenase subunit beta